MNQESFHRHRNANRRRIWRFLCRLMLLLFVIAGISILWIQLRIRQQAEGKTFDKISEVSGPQVALVFGCDDQFRNRENLYFKYRMEAAAALWHAGKLSCLIVSGDNRSKYYNEPKKMKMALIARGVPADRIVCDFAGLRTLDSVVRAKTVFGVHRCLFVSQQFQNERAICIGEAHGMLVSGFNARDVDGPAGRKTKWREFAARLMMWLDLYAFNTKPRHGGAPIALPVKN
ncbi:MAG: hypothetical protein RLZZ224_1084 [Verrucomicrobiota bacterium]